MKTKIIIEIEKNGNYDIAKIFMDDKLMYNEILHEDQAETNIFLHHLSSIMSDQRIYLRSNHG